MDQLLFKALESNQSQAVDEAKDKFRKQFNSIKEAWLVNGLVDYFIASNSLRAVDVLVAIREPHDKFLFDRVAETLRPSSTRLGSLTLLGHIVQRQPTWLYKIVDHPTLMKDLLRILKTESDVVEVISALLVLNVLLPIIPGLIGSRSHLTDIFEVFSRLAAWNSDNPRQLTSSHVLHLQVALYALFYQLYGMFPCTFLSYLKQEYNVKCDSTNACNVFNHTIKPMIETVRLHPFLIMSSMEEELCTERWKKSEHHAVVFNCTRFLLDGTSESSLRPLSLSNLDTSTSLESSKPVEPADFTPLSPPHSYLNGLETPRFSLCSYLSGTTTPAPQLGPETTPTSIPNTPHSKPYSSSSSFPPQEGSSPPEAAIEATPETTPVKDVRPRGRAVQGASHAVCALTDFTSPSSHSRKPGDMPSPTPRVREGKDVFSFPPVSNTDRKPPLFRLLDERYAAQESLASGSSERRSAPTSPLTISQDTLLAALEDNRDGEFQMNSSDSGSHYQKAKSTSDGQGPSGTEVGDGGFPEDPCSGGEGGVGSPCSRGGLHMPDTSSIMWFKTHRKPRPRYQTECTIPTSQSLGLTSPRDVYPPVESRVRRAMSCPEMKKSGGGSMTGSVGSAGPPLPEENEDPSHIEICTSEDATTQTEDLPPSYPSPPSYEHLFLGIFPSTFSYHHTHSHSITHHHHHYASPTPQPPPSEDNNTSPYLNAHSLEPCCVKDYRQKEVLNNSLESSNTPNTLMIRASVSNLNVDSEFRFYKEQIALMNLQLHFERHRRQVHLERNRRLLGKSRTNRAIEEHNSALRDQVCLLQKDIESSSEEMRDLSADQRTLVESLETSARRFQNENATLHGEMGRLRSRCESLEQETKAETEKRSILNQILHETKAKLFDSNNEMEHYKAAILENKRLNNDLTYLQKEIIILGEMNSKYKDILSALAQMKNECAYSTLLKDAYTHQVDTQSKLLDTTLRTLDAVQCQNSKLEAALTEKDRTIDQFKHLFTTIKTSYQENLEAMTSRYNSVRASLSRQRKEEQELYYKLELSQSKLNKLSSRHTNNAVRSTLGPPPSSSTANPNYLVSLSSAVASEQLMTPLHVSSQLSSTDLLEE